MPKSSHKNYWKTDYGTCRIKPLSACTGDCEFLCSLPIVKVFSSSSDPKTYDSGNDLWSKAGRTFVFHKCTHKYADYANNAKVAECRIKTTESSCTDAGCDWNKMPYAYPSNKRCLTYSGCNLMKVTFESSHITERINEDYVARSEQMCRTVGC